ncbi:MAG: hypothetical protein FJX74_16095 [Armatimonadetes bacterium]|nr:hypothetical protein [Armatimonadota bacterium]
MDDQDQVNEVFGVSFIDILACTNGGLIFITIMVIGMLSFKMGDKSSGSAEAVHKVRAVTARAAELYVADLGDAVLLDELQGGAERFRQWLKTLDPKTTIVGFHVDLGGAETFRLGTQVCTEENVPWVRIDEGALESRMVSCREGKVILDETGVTVGQSEITDAYGAFHQWLDQLSPDKHFIVLVLYPDGHESWAVAEQEIGLAGFTTRVNIITRR